MKWEEDADPEDADEDDNAEFDKMRKVGEILSSAIFCCNFNAACKGITHFLGFYPRN